MEQILAGWLVKSPPERKTAGSWKIFGAKWRKRYFVLYAPPGADNNSQETVTAILEYYTSKKLHTKCGSIDLANCEEVYSALESDTYKHAFCIQTTHKCKRRTYYLAAESEAEMNKWVNVLCRVLGLTESEDQPLYLPAVIEARLQEMLQPLTLPRPVTQPPVSTKPRPNFATHPTAKPISPELPPLRPVTVAAGQRYGGSEPNLLEAVSSSLRDDTLMRGDDREHFGSPPFGSGMRNAGSVPELDLLSPKRIGPNREELPPIPPEKGAGSVSRSPAVQSQFAVEYDSPQQSYYDAPGKDDSQCYNVPPTKYLKDSISTQDDCYNVPSSRYAADDFSGKSSMGEGRKSGKLVSSASVDRDVYNVPREQQLYGNVGIPDGDSFDNVQTRSVPKSRRDTREDSVRSRNSYPPPSATASLIMDQTYDVPVPSEASHNKGSSSKPSHLVPAESHKSRPLKGTLSACATDQTYDIPPPKEEAVRSKSHPIESMDKKPVKAHNNTPASSYVDDQMYDVPPSKGSVANNKGLSVSHHTGEISSAHHKSPHGSTSSTVVSSTVVLSEETYDVPPASKTAAHMKQNVSEKKSAPTHSGAGHPIPAPRGHSITEETYDVPPASFNMRVTEHSSGKTALVHVEANKSTETRSPAIHPVPAPRSTTIMEDMYDVPPTHAADSKPNKAPAIPPKSNPPPPPKPPRPTQPVAGVVLQPSDASISYDTKLVSSEKPFHITSDKTVEVMPPKTDPVSKPTLEEHQQQPQSQDFSDKDTLSDLPKGGMITSRFLQKESFHSSASNTPPCIARKGSNVEIQDSIRLTQRSKSFKRSLPSQQRSALPLPTKRIVERSESSSDDDDSSSPVSQDRSLLDGSDVQSPQSKAKHRSK